MIRIIFTLFDILILFNNDLAGIELEIDLADIEHISAGMHHSLVGDKQLEDRDSA